MSVQAVRFDEASQKKLERIKNNAFHRFLDEYIELCKPDKLFVCTDSIDDIEYIRQTALNEGEETSAGIKGHTVHFDGYLDQARDRERTKVLVTEKSKLDPKIRSLERGKGIAEISDILNGIMKGRTMYVCFYSLGPNDSEFSIPCVQLTDSSYVAHSEFLLYRPSYDSFVRSGDENFFKFVHSQGEVNETKTSKDVSKKRIYIDLEDNTVFSTNTQYAGNTVGLKKLALRLTLNKAMNNGWLSEHMFIMGLHGPKDRVTYVTGAFPSMCGKTSTSMMPGETIVGDDLAFLRISDGHVMGANVEKGSFGVVAGINSRDDPVLWKAFNNPGEVVFSNILLTDTKEVYWMGKDGEVPAHGYNHSGNWTPGTKDRSGKEIPASHPNARFTVELKTLENLDPNLDNPNGVKIDAIVYGGRDYDTSVPVEETFDWTHGIITKGASLESETTAATIGKKIREFNPMSNGDFLSIPISTYIRNNIDFGKDLANPPIIFGVNYYLKGEDGKFLNGMTDKRVWYKWIELRVHKEVDVIKTPTGGIPKYADLRKLFQEVLGKEYSKDQYFQQFTLRVPQHLEKIERIREIYKTSVSNIPEILFSMLDEQEQRLEDTRVSLGDYVSPDQLSK
ncbi:MAG: phosphoenolpyruvate carboxykinase (GTP) [Nitrososphaerales archaeon]